MNTFQCNNCGFQLQRPTQPYTCPQCQRQAIGLFRLVGYAPPAQGGGWPAQPGMPQQGMPPAQPGGWPQQPGVPAQPAGTPQQPAGPGQLGMPPQQPGGWPSQPAVPQQPGGWPPPQPVMPQPQQPSAWPQQPTGWPQQPAMPQQPQQPGGWPQQPTMPQQQPAGWPQQPAMPQQPAGPWPAQPGIPAGTVRPRPYQPGVPPAAPGGAAAMPPPSIPPALQPPTPPQPPLSQPPLPPHSAGQPAQPSQQRPVRPAPQQPHQGRTAAPATSGTPTPPPSAPRKPAPAQPAAPSREQPRPPKPQRPAPAAPASPPSASAPAEVRQPTPAPIEKAQPAVQQAPPAAQPRPPAEPAPRRPSPSQPARQPARQPAAERPAAERPRPAPAPQPVRPVARPQLSRPQQFVWAFPEEPAAEDEGIPLRNAPAVDSAGRIFLHLRGRLFALEVSAGKPQVAWEYVTGKHAPGPAIVGPCDAVYLHTTDGYLHCIDGASGKQNWPPAYVGEPLGYATPIVDPDGNIWISALEGGLIKVDSQGRVQKPGPFFRTRQKFDSAGIIAAGVLYIGADSGYVFAIQAEGERGVNLWNHAGDQGFAGWCIHSAPAMTADGILVVAGHDDLLFGFSAGGTPAWKTTMPGQMLGSPVLDRYGHIYAGVSQFPRGRQPRGLLVCLDGNSHKIRWEYRAAGAVESTPVIGDDDVIYFGDNTGQIHAVDFHGQGLWTAQVGAPVRSAGTILAPGRVAFGLDNETLVVLECSSGGLAAEGWPKIGRTLGQTGTE